MASPRLTVAEVSESLQHFGIVDYIVFMCSLLICVVIGLYFGWKDWQAQRNRKRNAIRRGSEALNYLVGGRKMKIFPVAMSLIASFISGIAIMGASTETYLYGTQFCYIFTAIIAMAFSMNYIFLPVYQGLDITSAYGYLQLRFDRRLRLLGSGLFTLATVSDEGRSMCQLFPTFHVNIMCFYTSAPSSTDRYLRAGAGVQPSVRYQRAHCVHERMPGVHILHASGKLL